MNFISHFVVVAAWLSFRSLPPKEAMVAFVVTDILRMGYILGGKRKQRAKKPGNVDVFMVGGFLSRMRGKKVHFDRIILPIWDFIELLRTLYIE